MILKRPKEISKVNQYYLTKMSEFIEAVRSLTSEERASIYGKVIEAAIIRGFSKSADTFNQKVKKTLEKANQDNMITIPATTFYIVMILLFILRRGSLRQFQANPLGSFIQICGASYSFGLSQWGFSYG